MSRSSAPGATGRYHMILKRRRPTSTVLVRAGHGIADQFLAFRKAEIQRREAAFDELRLGVALLEHAAPGEIADVSRLRPRETALGEPRTAFRPRQSAGHLRTSSRHRGSRWRDRCPARPRHIAPGVKMLRREGVAEEVVKQGPRRAVLVVRDAWQKRCLRDRRRRAWSRGCRCPERTVTPARPSAASSERWGTMPAPRASRPSLVRSRISTFHPWRMSMLPASSPAIEPPTIIAFFIVRLSCAAAASLHDDEQKGRSEASRSCSPRGHCWTRGYAIRIDAGRINAI